MCDFAQTTSLLLISAWNSERIACDSNHFNHLQMLQKLFHGQLNGSHLFYLGLFAAFTAFRLFVHLFLIQFFGFMSLSAAMQLNGKLYGVVFYEIPVRMERGATAGQLVNITNRRITVCCYHSFVFIFQLFTCTQPK